MSTSTTTQPTQEFQCHSTNEVLEIATYLDPETGGRIVRWEEIQAEFENAKSIRNGKMAVPFLRDASLKEIIPRRIAYHPGIVLQVIINDRNIGHSHSHGHDHTLGHDLNYPDLLDLYHITPSIQSATRYTAVNPTSTPPATMTSAHRDTDSSSFVVSSSLHNTLTYNTLSAQVTMQASMQHSINQQLDGLRSDMDKNRELQEQVLGLQLSQKQTSEEMKEMQKATLDRLAIIQNRVQAILAQTYELHEYPIPRLFIVLPKATGVFDKIKKPFANQFRLYFLCECGSHTMDEGSKIQHKIHLAKHEGYDLERPTEFFERYGSYILLLMNMVKYGITAAGLVVSPLSSLKIVDGMNNAQQHMDYLKKNIGPLVDSTIDFLDDFKRNNELGEEIASDHTEFDQLEALEGADLRQLESYLRVKDKGRVLANLYRIVTDKGHVKWVCFDHYRAAYRESAVRELRGIIEVNRGTFIEEIGRIKIKIATSTLAKQVYDAMIKARGIQELDITLQWDATMADLRTLASAISKTNMAHITVHGSYFKSPPLDVVNRSQRFNPILQLTSNSRVQSLQLCGFDSFFSRVTKSALAPAPKLRVFKYDAPLASKDKDLQTVNNFLGHCSTLSTLEMNLDPQQSITKTVS